MQPRRQLRACSACGTLYRRSAGRCTSDGAELRPFDRDPLLGTVLGGRYRIERCLAEGATARLYRGSHPELGELAIKVPFGEVSGDDVLRRRFLREARAAASLDHPNLVSVIDFGATDHGLLYLVMPHIYGAPLAEILGPGRELTERAALSFAERIARGLAHAHGRGLVHRDLKPANILLACGEGSVEPKIVDFGLALATGSGAPRLTGHGAVLGTPPYIAPEHILGDPVDARADLYALGALIFEMLAGRPLFRGRAIAVITKTLWDPPPPIPRADVSERTRQLVDRLLAKRANERFESADALAQELRAALRAASGSRILDQP